MTNKHTYQLYLTDAEKEALSRYALDAGMSMNAYAKQKIFEGIPLTIDRQSTLLPMTAKWFSLPALPNVTEESELEYCWRICIIEDYKHTFSNPEQYYYITEYGCGTLMYIGMGDTINKFSKEELQEFIIKEQDIYVNKYFNEGYKCDEGDTDTDYRSLNMLPIEYIPSFSCFYIMKNGYMFYYKNEIYVYDGVPENRIDVYIFDRLGNDLMIGCGEDTYIDTMEVLTEEVDSLITEYKNGPWGGDPTPKKKH